eukprot:gene6591-6819_t
MHFNITVDIIKPQNYSQILIDRNISRTQVTDYLRRALAQPSGSCCRQGAAHARLSSEKVQPLQPAQLMPQLLGQMDLTDSVTRILVMFTGAEEEFWKLLVAQLAAGCSTRLLPAATCPNGTDTNSPELSNQAPGSDQRPAAPDSPEVVNAAEASVQVEGRMPNCLPPEVDSTVAQLQQQILAAAVNESHVVGL